MNTVPATPADAAVVTDAGTLTCRDPPPLPAATALDLDAGGTTCETAALAPTVSDLTLRVPASLAGESVRWVRVRVDLHQTLVLTAGATSASSVGMEVRATCTGEPLGRREPNLSGPPNVRWWREANGPAEVLVRLSSTSGAREFHLARAHEPSHAACDCALPLTGSALPVQDLPSAVTPLSIPAPYPATGNYGLHYTLTVPARHQLVARATRLRFGSTATLSVHPTCDLSQRYEYTDTPPQAAGHGSTNWRTIRMVNASDIARPVVLLLSTGGLSQPAPNDLHVSVVPIASNTSCDTARAVTDGTVLPGEDLAGADTRVAACEESATLYPTPALVYRVSVGARRRLTVDARALDLPPDLYPYVRVFDRCGDARCLARSVAAGSSVATFDNGSDAAREVFVALSPGGYDATPLGRVRLAFTSEPL